MSTTEEQLKKLYEGQLTSQKEQLQQDYTQADADLTEQQEKLQKATDENLRRTAADAQIATMNNERYAAASGLSSGARAQARLSLENQARADMTALRAAQTEADADVERQRSILSQEYASAIRKAQADNDLALAQALYEEAEKREAELRAQQEAAANLMAQAGDYTRVGTLYGLSNTEVAKLSGASTGSTGGSGNSGGSVRTVDNGGLNKEQIRQLQAALNKQGHGLSVDGLYGAKSRVAAGGLSAADAYAKYVTYSYDSIMAGYIAAKNNGAKQTELDAELRQYVALGYLTEAQASRLRRDADDIRRKQWEAQR